MVGATQTGAARPQIRPDKSRMHSVCRWTEDAMKQSLRRFTSAALMLIFTSGGAWAQLSTAQMSGQVSDESGAVLPGVTVTATQTDTGATRTVVTGDDGAYVLPNL